MTDLAVLKLPGGGFPALPIGDSSHVEIAEPVMAIGHPFGLGHTVTMGIVSAVGRTNLGLAEHEEFIQTDATINPGDSGGALINSCGELIGINTALFSTNGSSLGIGFAIPANLARSVLEQLLAHGHVRRGWLGVVVQELSPALARGLGIPLQRGVLVTEVLQRNPAAQAGLNQNDVIIRFGESSIENSKQFGHMVTQIPPGNHVAVTVFRNGGETTLKVTVAERPRAPQRDETTEIEFDQLGIVVTDLSLALAKRLGLPLTTQGVAVIDVLPGSTAQAAGLQSGDVVQQVNRQSIISIKDFERTVARTPSQPLVFFVKRKGMAMYVVIEPAG
jgi:serine protease Do